MQYSAKLKRVMKQLREILEKEGVGASVILHEPGFSEFMLHTSTPYSCAFIEGDQLRIRSKRADYPSLAAQKKVVTDTINMLQHFRDNSAFQANQLSEMIRRLDQQFEINQTGGERTSQHELDN